MAVLNPPCDGCTEEATSLFSFPCIECGPKDSYRHFAWDEPAAAAGKDTEDGDAESPPV